MSYNFDPSSQCSFVLFTCDVGFFINVSRQGNWLPHLVQPRNWGETHSLYSFNHAPGAWCFKKYSWTSTTCLIILKVLHLVTKVLLTELHGPVAWPSELILQFLPKSHLIFFVFIFFFSSFCYWRDKNTIFSAKCPILLTRWGEIFILLNFLFKLCEKS